MTVRRYDFGRAARAMRVLERDQTDIRQVFEIADALPGHALQVARARLKLSAFGRRLLREQPNMAAILGDTAKLAAMPQGSVAAGYLRFMSEERIDAASLVAADRQVRRDNTLSEEQFVWEHLRDTHDLWHVITGYHGDLVGEPALQAFMFAQLGMPGSAFLALAVFAQAPPGVRPVLADAFVDGLRARWLFGQDWVALLPRPLAEVRAQLRVTPARPYTPMRLANAA
jgi:ubiquinone biosynthesis protein COQ4